MPTIARGRSPTGVNHASVRNPISRLSMSTERRSVFFVMRSMSFLSLLEAESVPAMVLECPSLLGVSNFFVSFVSIVSGVLMGAAYAASPVSFVHSSGVTSSTPHIQWARSSSTSWSVMSS